MNAHQNWVCQVWQYPDFRPISLISPNFGPDIIKSPNFGPNAESDFGNRPPIPSMCLFDTCTGNGMTEDKMNKATAMMCDA
jgi:hypothetical protein